MDKHDGWERLAHQVRQAFAADAAITSNADILIGLARIEVGGLMNLATERVLQSLQKLDERLIEGADDVAGLLGVASMDLAVMRAKTESEWRAHDLAVDLLCDELEEPIAALELAMKRIERRLVEALTNQPAT